MLTRVENISNISCSVYSPDGFSFVFSGSPHYSIESETTTERSG